MSSNVVNPTNAPPRPNQAMPFLNAGRKIVALPKPEDRFNAGKDYLDEGAPLLTGDIVARVQHKPAFAMAGGIVNVATKQQIAELSSPDETSQTQVQYLREAVVMDVDAKLVTSTIAQMRRGVRDNDLKAFREASYPTLKDYYGSQHYRQLRESRIIVENLVRASKPEEGEDESAPIGIRFNPKLTYLATRIDNQIIARLKESRVLPKDFKAGRRLREDFFTQDAGDTSGFGQILPNFDGGNSFALGGRSPDFTPLLSGPYNKQLYYFDYLDMHSKAFQAWCLAGNTEVACLDGKDRSVLELREELKRKKFVWGYKYNQDTEKIEPVKMTNVYDMGLKSCVCVLLDNGRSFIVSEDHPMLMRDGSYKESGKLQVDDSMMPLHRVYKRPRGQRGGITRDGYERIWQPSEGCWELTHVVVMKAVTGKSEKELFWKNGKQYVIHHNSFDKRDNCPEKLSNISESKHLAIHRAKQPLGFVRLWKDPEWKTRKLAQLSKQANTLEANSKKAAHLKGKKQPKWLVDKRTKGVKHPMTFALRAKISKTTRAAMATPEVRGRYEEGMKYRNHKIVAVSPVGKMRVYHIETDEQKYKNQNFALSVGVFSHNTHNPVAKRIVKVISQFVLGKGVKITVMQAEQQTGQFQLNQQTQKQQAVVKDWRAKAQEVLDRHWVKNSLHIRSKQILRDLIIFGENFIRYFDAPWGLKIREIDPSTVWEVVTDPDDCENEFYLHQQYPTKYQWYVDLPVPTIKFIIRQVPSLCYFHMKINVTAGEVRGRSELFAILGWLVRLKEFASDRVIRNKMGNLFVLDVAVEGDATAVETVKAQFAMPPTPGSFFIHNMAAKLSGVPAEIGGSDTTADWELLLTVIAMGAGLSQQYLGMGGTSSKAEALVGTEPDVKTFEDYQELMEQFFLQDAQRVFERAQDKGELPHNVPITVEVTYPALAEENRSEKLKDLAFGESMSWWSHRRIASAAAKELQFTSYDYDTEQAQIAQEDAEKEMMINTAYQQVVKGQDSASQQPGATGGGSSSGSLGKGASGMGMGKLPGAGSSKSAGESVRETRIRETTIPATAPGTSTASHVSGMAVTHNASVSPNGKTDPWAGGDPRDMADGIKREATNLRYQRHAIGRRQDRIQTPDKIRDQKSLRSDVLTKAKKAQKGGYNESKGGITRNGITRFPREDRRSL